MTTEIIGTSTETYEIKRSWDDSKPRCLVIELYPTIAINSQNIGCMDLSTMHLMKHLSDLGEFGGMSVCNLFARICENGKPSAKSLQMDEKNLEYISGLLDGMDEQAPIILAWGNSLASHKITNDMKITLIKMLIEKGRTKQVKYICSADLYTEQEKYPLFHPLFLGIRSKEKWELVDISVERLLKELSPNETEETSEVKQEKKTRRKSRASDKDITGK
jgi:hypothetical protein